MSYRGVPSIKLIMLDETILMMLMIKMIMILYSVHDDDDDDDDDNSADPFFPVILRNCIGMETVASRRSEI